MTYTTAAPDPKAPTSPADIEDQRYPTEPMWVQLLGDTDAPLPGDGIMNTWSEHFGEMRDYRIRPVPAGTPGAFRPGPVGEPICDNCGEPLITHAIGLHD